jgi:NADH-quinone oxidoreductase subunit L
MDLIWLIPILPGLGAAINGLFGVRYFSKRTTGLVACTAMAGALALALFAFFEMLGLPADSREHTVRVASWISNIPLQLSNGAVGTFSVPWGFRLDPLSGLMILVVTGIGFLIHVYSTGYMHEEPRGSYARYFSYLNLFCFFMLTLVLGDNFIVMFVGWEGVGLCSYLLIGYYYEKKSASDAGKKAFITNRIGDWGFILGMFLVYATFGTLDFRAVADAAASLPVETAAFGTISLITILLFIGATGKSAQIPLHVWLPDAMEGPTPVSALIHAATMVTAGVYMVGRNAVLFTHAPMVMEVVAIVGVTTAFLAATIGLVQNDIKRVLAYSTVSQLGYMFLAMGVGAFAAGAFHLMTHAFFKALLFLCSGAVIHGMAGQQDMRHMGGLRKYLPVTFLTMMIGTLAIAGIPPLSGFFSKDEILYKTFLHNRLIWAAAAATALMTAFYMYRLMSMTFFGPYRGPAWEHGSGHGNAAPHDAGHGPGAAGHGGHGGGGASPAGAGHGGHGGGGWHGPHEAPKSMTVPLIALAAGAIIAGLVGVPQALWGNNAIEHFLEPSFTARTVVVRQATAPAVHEAPALSERQATGESKSDSSTLSPEAGEQVAAVAVPAEAGTHGVAVPAAAGAHAAGEGGHLSWWGEIGLMAFSVLLAVIGIATAWRFYVRVPEISDRLAARWAGAHRVLSNKYYVDELYDATFIRGTMASADGLWVFDATVVDGAVNGTGWLTIFSSWFSHLIDKYIVDGLVNFVGAVFEEGSFLFRRAQTGLIQNYALVMLVGVFAFVSIYLFVR